MALRGDGICFGYKEHLRCGWVVQRNVACKFSETANHRAGANHLSQITNSAPSHASLGTLNGIAQTLSAAGRSFGPFVSGSLFSLSIHVQPKGEALAWGLFGGIALAGWLGTYAIHGEGLESTDDGYEEEGEGDEPADGVAP